MSNPMAQSEPVEQRFGVAGASEEAVSTAPTRQIDGTDVVEQGTLAAENVLEAMKDVIDPELGINIVDLGLVYGIVIGPQNEVRLDMTLTSAACPLTDVIERQAQTILSSITDEVQINWVWMPPWGPDRITPDGREQLRAIGFNVLAPPPYSWAPTLACRGPTRSVRLRTTTGRAPRVRAWRPCGAGSYPSGCGEARR